MNNYYLQTHQGVQQQQNQYQHQNQYQPNQYQQNYGGIIQLPENIGNQTVFISKYNGYRSLYEMIENLTLKKLSNKYFEYFFTTEGLYVIPRLNVRNERYIEEVIVRVEDEVRVKSQMIEHRYYFYPGVLEVQNNFAEVEIIKRAVELSYRYIFIKTKKCDFVTTNYGVLFVGDENLLKRVELYGIDIFFKSASNLRVNQNITMSFQDERFLFIEEGTNRYINFEELENLKELIRISEEVKKNDSR